MRSTRLATAVAAVLVTLHASVAIAKENDRLAQKLATTDEDAPPSGGSSAGELGWDDEAGDVGDGDGEGNLLRYDEGDPVDVGEGANETDPQGALASLDWSSFIRNAPDREGCYGACLFLNAAGCLGSFGGTVTSWVTLGTTTIPWLLATGATCGAFVTNQCQTVCDKVFQ